MRRAKWQIGWITGINGALAILAAGFLLNGGHIKAQGPQPRRSRTVRGTVESMTTAPKGEIDGAVLDDGTVIHWPPHLAGRFSSVVAKGERIMADGRMETGRQGDTLFEVRTVTNIETNATVENDGRGPREKRRKEKPPAPPRNGSERNIQGKVERLTRAPKGEIDGAVLDDGTFLHWPPHLEDRFANLIAEGDRVKAAGVDETGKRGEERFEVYSLTNLRTNASAEIDDLGPRPP